MHGAYRRSGCFSVRTPRRFEPVCAYYDGWMRTTLSSRFDVIRRLGAGGMGVVYEARDRKSGERLAIKTLHDREATALYRLKKEFRGLQNIIHPNLIQFRELIEEDGEWFLVMEFVEGCDARAYVRGHDDAIALAPTSEAAASASTNDASAAPITPPRDYDRLRDVIGQIAAALDHLHATERLHCDVKPANVVVDRTGRAVLLDLGLARLAIGGNSSTDGLAGTLPYVSPEQVTGAPASAASDCYALGVLLFELLTGRWPFTGTAIQILHAKCSGEAPTSLLPSTTPDDLRELCISLLRRDPAGRPSARNVVRI
ncbi:MAG TPA: serine/threonine-protein kinase, partial [Kofleriaceae bacterium]